MFNNFLANFRETNFIHMDILGHIIICFSTEAHIFYKAFIRVECRQFYDLGGSLTKLPS